MSASIRQADLIATARQFALPQIHVVNPKLVVCLGLVTFNALRQACDLGLCPDLSSAIDNPFNIGEARVWCQAHTGAFGQNNRNKGGVDRVSDDWHKMKSDFRATGNRASPRGRVQRSVEATKSECGRSVTKGSKASVEWQKSNVSVPLATNRSKERQMIVYFNNCQGKNHRLYGKDAFYDLWATDSRATNLSAGQECIVATKAKNGDITFSWFSLSHEAPNRYEGRPSRVFYGDFIKSHTYSKAEAARTEPYSTFFDKNGNFKRQSVVVR